MRDRLIPIVGREVLQEVLNRVRATVVVEYAPGVPHFEQPGGPAGEGPIPRVVVEGGEAARGGPGSPRE